MGTKYTQLQIVNALRLGERERAFKMLLNLDNANHSLGPDDFTFVLDYCAKTPDPLVRSMVDWLFFSVCGIRCFNFSTTRVIHV